ncbi:LytR/AlgR family response regulator transcription factor [Litoribacter ruber]|nr:LytTR family DNA-binding domain-containing protein [Litoribacter alkaliphilus]
MNHKPLIASGIEHRKYLLRMTMKEVEAKMGPKNFVRIHRSYIVNMHAIRRHEGRRVELVNGEVLPVGRSFLKGFMG